MKPIDAVELLPREVLAMLQPHPLPLQTQITRVLAEMLGEWETRGVVLDPLQLEAILITVTSLLLGTYGQLLDLNVKLNAARRTGGTT